MSTGTATSQSRVMVGSIGGSIQENMYVGKMRAIAYTIATITQIMKMSPPMV